MVDGQPEQRFITLYGTEATPGAGSLPGDGAERGDGHRLRVGIGYQIVKSLLSHTSGFIAAAGFTHSLSPARNCTYGCSYCYVPTLGVFGGLQPLDSTHWGEFTTFKANAPELLHRSLRPHQAIYCSPLVDPYQPAEAVAEIMPRLLDVLALRPPRVFVIQTRGPLILRDLAHLVTLAERTTVRISVSLTTNREDIRRRYEPHCATMAERVQTIAKLRDAGLEVYATLAPILPCDPEELVRLALDATDRDVIADPLHSRDNRAHGAVTRQAACRISERVGLAEWHDAAFQAGIVDRMRRTAEASGRHLGVGIAGFARLAAIAEAG